MKKFEKAAVVEMDLTCTCGKPCRHGKTMSKDGMCYAENGFPCDTMGQYAYPCAFSKAPVEDAVAPEEAHS